VLEFDEFGTYLEGAIGKRLRSGRRISGGSEWVVSAMCRISGSMDDRGEHRLAGGSVELWHACDAVEVCLVRKGVQVQSSFIAHCVREAYMTIWGVLLLKHYFTITISYSWGRCVH
jgi:hypothetical protein